MSETTSQRWFSTDALRTVRRIERRIVTILRVSPTRFEEWQAVRYRRGGRFDYHLDAGFWSHEPAGERVWTVLIYLDTPSVGGATRFKALDVEVRALTGRLLVWRNQLSNGAPDAFMVHSGAPVRRGRKTILVTWIRERRARPL